MHFQTAPMLTGSRIVKGDQQGFALINEVLELCLVFIRTLDILFDQCPAFILIPF